MRLEPLIAAAYAEIQGRFGIKPDLKRTIKTVLKQPDESDFYVFRYYVNPQGAVYVDAGAHRGRTIESVRLFQANLRIVAFEPNPCRIDELRTFFTRDHNVTIEPYGLADTSGVFDLFVPYYKGAAFDGLASLHRDEAEHALSSRSVWRFDRKYLDIRKVSCMVRRLDDFALRIGFSRSTFKARRPR